MPTWHMPMSQGLVIMDKYIIMSHEGFGDYTALVVLGNIPGS